MGAFSFPSQNRFPKKRLFCPRQSTVFEACSGLGFHFVSVLFFHRNFCPFAVADEYNAYTFIKVTLLSYVPNEKRRAFYHH